MYSPHDETRRYSRDGLDPYNSPSPEGTGNGGLIALLVVILFIGGVIAFSSSGSGPEETPEPAAGAETPQSVTGGGNGAVD